MLGRFLEISIAVDDILESIRFYESLGFTQAETGSAWPHPYAVLTDGRLFLGLHRTELPSPILAYVQPDLRAHVERLEAMGLAFDSATLDLYSFNEASLQAPEGQRIRLVEARTFSPPSFDASRESLCGYFAEFGLPTRDLTAASAFWEGLGFVGLDEETEPFARKVLASDHLNIGLYRTRALRHPVLTFEDADMKRRLALLRQRGFELSDEMPDALDGAENAVLTAPEGTRLLLLSTAAGNGQPGLQ